MRLSFVAAALVVGLSSLGCGGGGGEQTFPDFGVAAPRDTHATLDVAADAPRAAADTVGAPDAAVTDTASHSDTDDDPCRRDPAACAGPGCVDGRCGACAEASDCPAGRLCGPEGVCRGCDEANPCTGVAACREGFCLPASPPVWNLIVAAEDWARLHEDVFTRLYVPCAVDAGGRTFDVDCEVRLLGGSSRALPKKSFRVRFSEEAEHPGFSRRINLRAEYGDPSGLRQRLAHWAMGALTGLPAPRARFIDLRVNGAPYGLMVEVERIGPAFMRRHGRSDVSSTYEVDASAELEAQGAGQLLPLPDPLTYGRVFDRRAGDATDETDIIDFVEGTLWLDHRDSLADGVTVTDRLRAAIHTDRWIDWLAALSLLGAHAHLGEDYLLSHQPGLQGAAWEPLTEDLDGTFGCLPGEAPDSPSCALERPDLPIDHGVIPPGAEARYPTADRFNLLIHQLLTDPQLSVTYRQRLCALRAHPFWREGLPALVRAFATLTEAVAATDPNSPVASPDERTAAIGRVLTFVTQRAAFVGAEAGCEEP